MPLIEIVTDSNGMPFDEVARARMIMASVGDAPTIEETAASAASWLMPPERRVVTSQPSPPEGDLSLTDAQKRLAASYAAVPAWLVPPRAA